MYKDKALFLVCLSIYFASFLMYDKYKLTQKGELENEYEVGIRPA